MLDQIRYLTERGDFARAAVMWEEWSREFAVRIAAGQVDDAEWKQTSDLYRWSKDALLCARTGYLDQLNTLHAAEAYSAQQLMR